jgi:hypothetical protein
MPTEKEMVLQFMLALASNPCFDHHNEEDYLSSEIMDIAMELANSYAVVFPEEE